MTEDNYCPRCKGIRVVIDQFNHNVFHVCRLCDGQGKIFPLSLETIQSKNEIIIEFLTRTEGLAYHNKHGVCAFCAGGKFEDPDFPGMFTPRHLPTCLYSRAEAIVYNRKEGAK